MTTWCPVCKKLTDRFKAKIILGQVEPPRRVGIDLRYKTNVWVCPVCGTLSIIGADTDYMKMLSDEKFERVPEEEIKKINLDVIYKEIEAPMIHSQEKMIWVKEDMILSELDDLSNGITLDHANYYRLIRFLLLDPKERIESFGKVKCIPCEFSGESPAGLRFIDGRRRFSLFKYLGAKYYPVSVLPLDLSEIKRNGLEYYEEIPNLVIL